MGEEGKQGVNYALLIFQIFFRNVRYPIIVPLRRALFQYSISSISFILLLFLFSTQMTNNFHLERPNRENGTTFSEFLFVPRIFQWDKPKKRLPFTSQQNFREFVVNNPCRNSSNGKESGNLCLWNLESRKILLVESAILGYGIRNQLNESGIPLNPESKFH